MSGNPDYTKKNAYSAINGSRPDTVVYGYLNKTTGNIITANDWKLIETAVNQERVRRGSGAVAVLASTFTGFIEAKDLNDMKRNVEVAGKLPSPATYQDANDNTQYFPISGTYTGDFQGVTGGAGASGMDNPIYAEEINSMVNKVNNAGAVCVCNCNYCTCNCNYCTCNCNYTCTCNCNY